MLDGDVGQIRPPEKFLQEVAWIRRRHRVSVWEFDKIMGKCPWIFPLHRGYFSILYKSYHLLAYIRRGLEEGRFNGDYEVYLREDIRQEFKTIWVLSRFLCRDLQERSAEKMYASDSSPKGFAWVVANVDEKNWAHGTGLVETAHVTRLMHEK